MHDKPRYVLNEHKMTNEAQSNAAPDQTWDLRTFKKKFRVVIVRHEGQELEFDLVGINPFLANTFRRLLLCDVPSMAIEKVFIYNNTSIIQDEVLAHRLGLVPLKADPRLFEFRPEGSTESNEHDSLEFELKIKCSWNKEQKDSSRVDDKYKNHNVYSKHIQWLPIGEQASLYKEADIAPIHDDILIAKMRPGHELDLKLVAVKGIGRDHAKFSPVATAWYRLLPDIQLTREIEGEMAERLQRCFSPGVISLKQKEDGRKVAIVNDARYDTGSRNAFRYDDLKDSVVISRIQDHFIFTIESVGALPPDVLFMEAVKVLKNKCILLLDELNSV